MTSWKVSKMKQIFTKNVKVIWVSVISTFIVVGAFFLYYGQWIPTTSAQNLSTMNITQLLTLPGTLIAKGEHPTTVGQLNIRAYNVEQIKLSGEVIARVHEGNKKVTQAWRVTLLGGPFPVLAMPAQLRIDDVLAGYGVENTDLSEITFTVLDPSLIREGATLSFSYGVGAIKLTDKLHLESEP
jgi:hypothetical protein